MFSAEAIPRHLLTPCCAVCLYYEEPLTHPCGLVLELARFLADNFKVAGPFDFGFLNSHLDERDQATSRVLTEQQIDQTQSAVATACASSPTVSCHAKSGSTIDGFQFSDFILSYSAISKWNDCHGHSAGGPSLIVGLPFTDRVTPTGTVDHDVVENIVAIASQHGTLCHGVVDVDFYIANRQGYYYDSGRHYPGLQPRFRAARNWGEIGGEARKHLVRDPREGLILGHHLTQSLRPASLENVARKHGLSISRLGAGESHEATILWLKAENLSIENSVRQCAATRRSSAALFEKLCEMGFSRPEYVISHTEIDGSSIVWS